MNKIEQNVREALQNPSTKDERNDAIIYAKEKLMYSNSELCELTGLAISTIRNYVTKFLQFLQRAIDRFEKHVKQALRQVFIKDRVTYETKTNKDGCVAYFIEYFRDPEHTDFAFSKIGKTVHVRQRIKEHLRYYEKEYGELYPVVKRLYYFTNDDDAQTMENMLRKFCKSQADCGFVKLDRFTGIRYNKKSLDNSEMLQKTISLLDYVETA